MSSTSPMRGHSNSVVAHSSLRDRLALIARKLLPVGLFLGAGVALIVILGIAQRTGWLRDAKEPSAGAGAGGIFTCPMHPQIRQPSAGRCPICGMALVPVSAANAAKVDEFAVNIEPAQRRLANIQTAVVESSSLEDTIKAVGVIAIDESRQATIAAYIDGRLERLFADYTGVAIKKGDHLAVVYSPQLYAAQVEYVESRRALDTTSGLPVVRQTQASLVANTKQRLREFGMTDEQIDELEKEGKAQSRLTVYAPQAGTVVEKLAIEGNYVKAGDPIYRIAELSTVWLVLKLFPEEASRIRFGQQVVAVLQSLGGEERAGRVAFINPVVDADTRTVGVRVELMNEDGRLRPGDYAEARIHVPIGPQGTVFDAGLAGKWISPMHPQIIRSEPGQCPICGMDLVPTSQYGFANEPVAQPISLHVPRSAVLLAGKNSVVYVETKAGRFELRPVKVGPILRDKIVILEGLEGGELVATSGNFLIDSQMQLAGKPSLIDPSRVIARNKEKRGPLVLKEITVTSVAGSAGTKLEDMYAAYFNVHRALAMDTTPLPNMAQALHDVAVALRTDPALPDSAANLVEEIVINSEHLHHLDLAGVRRAFKPISQSMVRLASLIRSNDAQGSFVHFYCPMVPGGGGDWLQSDGELLNPYFGSEMLRCGEKVHDLPAKGSSSAEPARPRAAAEKAKGL